MLQGAARAPCQNARTIGLSDVGPRHGIAHPRVASRLCACNPKGRPVPKQAPEASDRVDLPPTRAAALRKWLGVANSRLLSLERHRRQLLVMAATLADSLAQRDVCAEK